MKIVLFLIALGAIETYANRTLEGLLDAAIQTKCVKNTNNINAAHQFTNAVQNYTECYILKIGNYGNEVPFELVDNICKVRNGTDYQGCLIHFTESISECLDETEDFLPKLILNGARAADEHFICGTNRISDQEYIANLTINDDCVLHHPLTLSNTDHFNLGVHGNCLSDLQTFKHLDKGILHFDKNVLHSDLLDLKKCWTEELQQNCNNESSRFVELKLRPYISQLELLMKNSSPGNFYNIILTMLLVSISSTLLVKIF